MTTESSPLARQPDQLDYASPTQFRFGIKQLPKVEFFTIKANLPGIEGASVDFANPFKNIPIMGDKLTYSDLTITFIVDEYLENYQSLHNWLGKTTADKAMYSDAFLMILSNKNNPILNVNFQNVFPTSLSGLDYTQGATDVEYMTADVTFKYQIYKFESV
jgi:hypothetical protein